MDGEKIPKLLEIANSPAGLAQAQSTAANALAEAGLPPFPHNACAATLSALLELAGIDIPMTLGAGRLAHVLGGSVNSRKWISVKIGSQSPGDVGVTFDEGGTPGADHIYLVLRCIGSDEMIIADNQAPTPHTRYVSGRGRTPTEYFLRAPFAVRLTKNKKKVPGRKKQKTRPSKKVRPVASKKQKRRRKKT